MKNSGFIKDNVQPPRHVSIDYSCNTPYEAPINTINEKDTAITLTSPGIIDETIPRNKETWDDPNINQILYKT